MSPRRLRRWSTWLVVAATSGVLASTGAAQASDTGGRVTGARERLRAFEGSYRVGTDTVTGAAVIWRWRSVLGGKYVELEETMNVAFRVTIGFDSTAQRYRLSLLDAGSGAVDIYEGDFDATGALVMQNPQFWRLTLRPTERGLVWQGSRSTDRGATWRERPPSEFVRVPALP